MTTTTRHGFLDGLSERATITRLVDYATREKLSHLWVMRGTLAGETGKLKTEYHDCLTYANKQGLLTSIVGRQLARPGGGPRGENVRVIFRDTATWPELPTGRAELAELITHMESSLGVPMFASPTSTGLRYLEKIDQRYHERYFADPGINKTAARDLFKQAGKPLVWSRIPTAQEIKAARYLVAIDKNAAYPRAAREAMGIGEAEQYTGPFDHLLKGHWLIEIKSGLENIDGRLPAPLWKGWQHTGVMTPVVKMLLEFGCEIEVKEALIWRKHAPVFERWSTTLWDMRQACPEHSPERENYKAIMNNTLGFAMNGDDEEDSKFRPDWHAQIQAYTRALMIYNARSIAQKSGLYPFGAYIDALYYLSPEPSIPGFTLSPGVLGGYKAKWTLPLSDEISELITDPQQHKKFALLLSALNQRAELTAAESQVA